MNNNKVYGPGLKYDLIYNSKNYLKEVNYIAEWFSKNEIPITNILDVGCGTGNHSNHLEKLGYNCLGIDPCNTMIEIAQTKRGKYKQCTLDTFYSKDKFSACISLFNIINHVLSLKELNSFFQNISFNLKPQGLFIFDCFNSISFNKESPLLINKPTHIISPLSNYSRGTLDLVSTSKIPELNYIINHRIWSIDIIRELLDNNQFKLLGIYKPFTYDKLNLNTDFSYKIQLITQKQ